MRDYEQILAEMPAGLDRAVLRLFSFHRGWDSLITREDLLVQVQKMPGMKTTEDRQLRDSIHELRKLGVRICHTELRSTDPRTGKIKLTFGYFLAETEQEYQEFRERYGSYARTIWQTIKAMDEKKAVISSAGEIEPPAEMAVQQSFL